MRHILVKLSHEFLKPFSLVICIFCTLSDGTNIGHYYGHIDGGLWQKLKKGHNCRYGYGHIDSCCATGGDEKTPPAKPPVETFLEGYFPYEPPLRVFRQFP